MNIFSSEETLNEIIKKNRSISRFGDGELRLIFGKGIPFQTVNKVLIKKLKKVLKSNKKGLLIGINIPYNNSYLSIFNDKSKNYYINFVEKYKLKLFSL